MRDNQFDRRHADQVTEEDDIEDRISLDCPEARVTADPGFVRKARHRFFAHSDVKHWSTKWETQNGEDNLVKLIFECPHCGQVREYIPNEATFPHLIHSEGSVGTSGEG